MRATDLRNGKSLVLKFPHPRVADDATYRLAFVNEAWVAARVRSPWIGEIIELQADRQTRLYSAMPFYDGETLEARLRREPKIDLAEGARIAARLARAIATLHRSGIIHRDIKPDNVMLLRDGGLRLVDLGVCRAPRLEDFPQQYIPGTPSYMAPELFAGASGRRIIRSICAWRDNVPRVLRPLPLWRNRTFQHTALRQAAFPYAPEGRTFRLGLTPLF